MTRSALLVSGLAAITLSCGGSDASVEECVDISDSLDEGAVVFIGGSLRRFLPEVAFVHWDCEDQRMNIVFSQQSCDPMAAEDQVWLQIYRQDIESGLFESGGTYALGGETYLTTMFVSDEGWALGTCGEEVGEITFDSLGAAAGDRVAASFDVPTTGCWHPDGLELPDGRIEGAFDLRIPESYESACPMGGDPHPRDR